MAHKLMFNFIKDIDEDIDRFVEQYLNNRDDVPDIDTYSETLRKCQQCVYRRTLPNGELFDLQIGNNPEYDYLYWFSPNYYGNDLEKSRFASDSIVNMQERYAPQEKEFIPDKNIKHYKNKLKKYVRAASTIGGEIIFPKHKYPISVNMARGRNHKIKDRFDLTLECIRRFYEKSESKRQSPLYDVLKADEKFFNLFKDFDNYVKFFYLDGSYVQGGKIKFFIGGDMFEDGKDGFEHPEFSPFPKNTTEWNRLYRKQLKYLKKRNKQIRKKISKCPILAK